MQPLSGPNKVDRWLQYTVTSIEQPLEETAFWPVNRGRAQRCKIGASDHHTSLIGF